MDTRMYKLAWTDERMPPRATTPSLPPLRQDFTNAPPNAAARRDQVLTYRGSPGYQKLNPPKLTPAPAQQAEVAARPIMAPAAQNVLFGALPRGQVNLGQVARAVYSPADNGVPGAGLQKAMRVASQYGPATADVNSLNRNVPVRETRQPGVMGLFRSQQGRNGTLNVNMLSPGNARPHNYLDTVGHELGHAMDYSRGQMNATTMQKQVQYPKFNVPDKRGKNQPNFAAAHEMMAGPVRAMKWHQVNQTGTVPSNPAEAEQHIQGFIKRYPDPSKNFPASYPKGSWDSFLKSPDRAKFYLQTVKRQAPQSVMKMAADMSRRKLAVSTVDRGA